MHTPEKTMSGSQNSHRYCKKPKILEALNNDIAVPCVVKWRMLRYSVPTNLNDDLLNDGVSLENFNETINLAINRSFILPFWRTNKLESFFLEAQILTVYARVGVGNRKGDEPMETWKKT